MSTFSVGRILSEIALLRETNAISEAAASSLIAVTVANRPCTVSVVMELLAAGRLTQEVASEIVGIAAAETMRASEMLDEALKSIERMAGTFAELATMNKVLMEDAWRRRGIGPQDRNCQERGR